jgi:non-ribosomal peptide synthase protein (TIGR01720 family)
VRFIQSADGSWQQHYAEHENEPLLESHDLRGMTEPVQDEELAAIGSRLHGSLNVIEGPLVRAAHIVLGNGRGTRLIVVVHHLVVDTVSWRILLEDWRRLHSQISSRQELQLPSKTASYGAWSRLLSDKVHDGLFDREVEYWSSVGAGAERSIPWANSEAKNLEESSEVIRVELNDEETRALLTTASQFYSAQTWELLIAGLGMALCRWVASSRMVITLEGHGREDRVPGVAIDLTRTVGWFTSIYPFELEARNVNESLGEIVRRVKERLRSVPHSGVGYGILRHLSEDDSVRSKLSAAGETAVVFNYLGKVESTNGDDEWYVTNDHAGTSVSGVLERMWEVDVAARVLDGRLSVSWRYSRDRLSKVQIDRVAGWYLDVLRAMVHECREDKQAALSHSDFTLVSLDSQDLDELIVQLGD